MKKRTKIILFATLATVLVLGTIGFYLNNLLSKGFDIDKTAYVYIDEKTDFDALLNQLDTTAKVKDMSAFKLAAKILNYESNIKVGRYAITPDMDVMDAIRSLKNGKQAPVRLTFNNIRTKEDLTVRISDQLLFTNDELLSALNNPDVCSKLGFNPQTVVAMFIPNTYEFYWDVKVETFLQRMNKEYNKFWNEDRLAKAKTIGITPAEVSTLASIVEEECTYTDEYPIVAGLYLNRVHRGQALQADPTVKFAVGDFSLRRILDKHLQTDSPYNTYRNPGLPPGPIRVPSIKGIDSVLNFDQNDYIYMCAKDDLSGRHNFAITYSEHQHNAVKYRNALNARKIF